MPELDKTSARSFEKYKQEFDRDPFAANTILLGQNLMQLVNDNRRHKMEITSRKYGHDPKQQKSLEYLKTTKWGPESA